MDNISFTCLENNFTKTSGINEFHCINLNKLYNQNSPKFIKPKEYSNSMAFAFPLLPQWLFALSFHGLLPHFLRDRCLHSPDYIKKPAHTILNIFLPLTCFVIFVISSTDDIFSLFLLNLLGLQWLQFCNTSLVYCIVCSP